MVIKFNQISSIKLMLKKAAKLKFNIEKIINEKFQAIQRNQFNIQLSLISHSLYLWGKIYRWSPAEWFRLITLMLRWLGLISWCMHTRLIKKIFSWINFKFHIIIERAIDRCRERERERRERECSMRNTSIKFTSHRVCLCAKLH